MGGNFREKLKEAPSILVGLHDMQQQFLAQTPPGVWARDYVLTYNQHRTKRWFPEFPQEQDADYPAKTGNGRGRTSLCFVSQATHPEGAGNYSIVVGTTEEVKWTINTDDMHTLRSALRCSLVPRFSCMAEVPTFLACHFIVVFVDRAILSKIIKECIRF